VITQDLNEDPKKHKFKFEGIVIEPTAGDIKTLFDYYISNKIKVKGNAIKREVVFNRLSQSNVYNNNNKENLRVISSGPAIHNQAENEYNEFNQNINIIRPSKNAPKLEAQNEKNTQNEAQLQDLKMELHKYRNQLNNLKDTHNSLKNRVEMERSRDNHTTTVISKRTLNIYINLIFKNLTNFRFCYCS